MLPGLVMRLLVAGSTTRVTSSAPTTSNGSKSDDIQLDVIKLVSLIHLLKEALHLFQGESDALLCRNLHHPLVERFRV